MLWHNGLKKAWRPFLRAPLNAPQSTRNNHYDGRNRLSNFWTPTLSLRRSERREDDGHELLLRAAFLRQAHSGIFHLLPLGLRVQNKIEQLLDKHMLKLGASKLSLSSISSQELWKRSGRLDSGRDSELFQFQDRKEAKYLLSPTHEEEISTIVANAVQSYKDLPLRLYQISRKYRDEARPRQGLLRGREFIMKDLYTFDVTEEQAKRTYDAVRHAYSSFLKELRLPYLMASADSGKMGGNLSHEFHFASNNGEDTIIKCNRCDYSINQELYIGYYDPEAGTVDRHQAHEVEKVKLWAGIGSDRRTAYFVLYPDASTKINITAIKKLYPDVDLSINLNVEDSLTLPATPSEWKCVAIRDPRVSHVDYSSLTRHFSHDQDIRPAIRLLNHFMNGKGFEEGFNPKIPRIDGRAVLLTEARNGDRCPICASGSLELQKSIEMGHTFHLGTRYSRPLDLKVLNAENKQVYVEMGCHGIGVSRLIGAIASLLADEKGLNWPLAIAPFALMIVPSTSTSSQDAIALYDQLDANGVDVAIDDRGRAMGWKLNDADLVGYPFIIVMGRSWAEKKTIELQCRRLKVKEEVEEQDVLKKIAVYSMQL